jgi:hypothetical protein
MFDIKKGNMIKVVAKGSACTCNTGRTGRKKWKCSFYFLANAKIVIYMYLMYY